MLEGDRFTVNSTRKTEPAVQSLLRCGQIHVPVKEKRKAHIDISFTFDQNHVRLGGMLHGQYVIFDKYCITLWPEETTATTSKEGNIQRKRLGYLSEAATSGPSVTHYACSIIWL